MSTHPYSLQLYTLREAVTDDLVGTLRRVAAIGFEAVELYRFERYLADYRTALGETGLRPLSGHAPLLDGDARAALKAASELGVATVIEPRIEASRWTTREDIEEAAAALNSVARIARDQGVSVGYHNHDHELRADFGGRTGLEVFAEALDEDVTIELDLYWAEVAGVPAADLADRLGQRVGFLHVKDGTHSGGIADQQPVGRGEMPVREVLRAVPHAVRIVEFDDYSGDKFEAVEQSLRYLKENDR